MRLEPRSTAIPAVDSPSLAICGEGLWRHLIVASHFLLSYFGIVDVWHFTQRRSNWVTFAGSYFTIFSFSFFLKAMVIFLGNNVTGGRLWCWTCDGGDGRCDSVLPEVRLMAAGGRHSLGFDVLQERVEHKHSNCVLEPQYVSSVTL